ncbi:hypothetical protein [Streptomyces sp. YGL11-2]|uniref:hypothetical protein n=1 Tax=Streptomyces sp. YGL11-2 TaxID=3414028 RepID=UPI003CF9FE40
MRRTFRTLTATALLTLLTIGLAAPAQAASPGGGIDIGALMKNIDLGQITKALGSVGGGLGG